MVCSDCWIAEGATGKAPDPAHLSPADRIDYSSRSFVPQMSRFLPNLTCHSLECEYRERGFLRESFALSDPSPLPQLCRDVALFDAKLAEWHARGHARVPYLFTEAIERVARDAAIRAVIEALLGTDAWVVWGPNICRETPNAASRWHVDLESRYWPSVSVAVGLSGCSAKAATWCLRGTHRLARTPFSCGDDGDTDLVLRNARRAKPDCGPPEQIAGFGDGRFYAFDARTWHRGEQGTSTNRLILFLHYQPADAGRVPLMLDYERHRWSRRPAAYLAGPRATPVTTVARLPVRERVLDLLGRLWR
jgi:hypothetical protein